MKAIVYRTYGSPDVLTLEEVTKPVAQDGQVLVKVVAASTAAGDWHVMRGEPFLARFMLGLFKPKYNILGADVAGRVEAVGRNVKHFQPGDEVFGDLSNVGFGAFAEYVAAPEQTFAHKPSNLTFAEAAAVPVSAITALQALRDHGKLQPGQQVLINGASGGVGTFAVQIAKSFGAEVTGVCSTRNVEMVHSLGADHVIDYTQEDFTHSERRYDLLLDNAGSRSWAEYQRILKPKAIFVIVGGPKGNRWIGPLSHVIRIRLASLRATQKVIFFIAKMSQADLVVLQKLLEAGKMTPVIDRQYALSELPDAMRYLGTGHAKGKVVISAV